MQFGGNLISGASVNYLATSLQQFSAYTENLVLLFPSLLTIPLARQRLFHTALFAWFEVEGVTLYFFNDVLRLHFALKPPQSILKRLAFLHANLCQRKYTSNPALYDHM
jgi:hypothetical protein